MKQMAKTKAHGLSKESTAKRQKKEKKNAAATSFETPLNEIDVEKLHEDFSKSHPYKHLVIENLCKDHQMRVIRDEIKDNMKANFKETDLFKVFQTGDLCTLSEGEAAKMPNLVKLRDAIYSEKFRSIVSHLTGCSDLTDRVDLSANAYANGCHLLCHDDVIGTRRVSYIIYLTDPDEPWEATDGGCVELYPLEKHTAVDRGPDHGGMQGIPCSVPTKCILPIYNSMLIFPVQPGRSYHSVQEVFCDGKPRLSISGWFHGPTPPKGSDKASLQQIMTKGDDDREFTPFPDSQANKKEKNKGKKETEAALSAEDVAVLREYVNPLYLQPQTMQDINDQFCENSSIQLNDFLRADLAKRITAQHILADFQEGIGKSQPQLNYEVGCSEHWRLVGPPHKRRHLVFDGSVTEKSHKAASGKVGAMLSDIRSQLFHSAAFRNYLRHITTMHCRGYRSEVRRFRAGLDYTVAHYGILTKESKLDATLCFVNDSRAEEQVVLADNKKKPAVKGAAASGEEEDEEEEEEEFEDVWDSGDAGGFECFIEAEEDPENVDAAEVYRPHSKEAKEGEETSLLSVSPSNNVISIVLRDEGIMKFVKFVSCNAPGSRWDVSCDVDSCC